MPVRATRNDDSDEWASRCAQDDSIPVILKRAALKNPGRRRTRSVNLPFYGREPRVPRPGSLSYGWDPRVPRPGSLSYGWDPRVPRRGIASLRMTAYLSF